MKYQPKGEMCAGCRHAIRRSCSHLDFSAMRPIKSHPDGVVEVRCTDYARPLMQEANP